MPIDEDEWQNGESEKGALEKIGQFLKDEHPKAYSSYDIYNTETSGFDVYKDRNGADPNDVTNLLQVLVSQGEVESKEVDGDIYYRSLVYD